MVRNITTVIHLLMARVVISSSVLAKNNPFTISNTAVKQTETPSDPQSIYKSKLLSNARRLDQDGFDSVDDLTNYSLKFIKCQFIKTYSSADNTSASRTTSSFPALDTLRFVVFHLCPSTDCESCDHNYGQYAISMSDYLEYTVEYRREEQQQICQSCWESCYYNEDDGAADEDDVGEAEEEEEGGSDGRRRLSSSSVDCDICVSTCQKIKCMEANYYVDATVFVKCQQIQEDNGFGALYAGPMCASYGSKIKIGVFKDEDCMYLDTRKDVEDYLVDEDGNQIKLSHALLRTVYDDSTCINCLADKEGDDDAAEDETKNVCTNLYTNTAKCEKAHHGFDNKVEWYNHPPEEKEEETCEFIDSLMTGTFDPNVYEIPDILNPFEVPTGNDTKKTRSPKKSKSPKASRSSYNVSSAKSNGTAPAVSISTAFAVAVVVLAFLIHRRFRSRYDKFSEVETNEDDLVLQVSTVNANEVEAQVLQFPISVNSLESGCEVSK